MPKGASPGHRQAITSQAFAAQAFRAEVVAEGGEKRA
jgi:hypothetical protein